MSGGGHHGGAWKVAYADFVTAMMAFFLLLWLITQVPSEKLSGLADYFTPSAGLKNKVGDTGKGGQGRSETGILQDAGAMPSIIYGAPDNIGDIQKAPETNVEETADYEGAPDEIEPYNDATDEGIKIDQKEDDEKLEVSEKEAEMIEAALEQKRFEDIAEEIKEQIEGNDELKEFAENLQIDQTDEGLRIQITDVEGMSMFEMGSSRLNIEVEPLLAKVSEIIQNVDNMVAVIGHTDSHSFGKNAEYTNWELSTDRANASRRFLIEAGLTNKRIHKVEGMADKTHFVPDDPYSPQNRRISIILIKKSLVRPQ